MPSSFHVGQVVWDVLANSRTTIKCIKRHQIEGQFVMLYKVTTPGYAANLDAPTLWRNDRELLNIEG